VGAASPDSGRYGSPFNRRRFPAIKSVAFRLKVPLLERTLFLLNP